MRAPTERPKVLLVFSIVTLVIAVGIGAIAYADQHKRVNDPVKYAEERCEASLPAAQVRTPAFERCARIEQAKSTIESILPLLVAGVIIGLLGLAGLVVGRIEVRAEKERSSEIPNGSLE